MNETIHQPVDELHSNRPVYFPRADGSRVPFKVYSSPEIYQLEQERIFRGPVWSFVAMEAEIPNPVTLRVLLSATRRWSSRATKTVVSRRGLTAALIGARWSAAPPAATPETIFALTINGATTRAVI